jgi:type VI secretion system secreted protein Hcp
MPPSSLQPSSLPPSSSGDNEDFFLKIELAKQGPIKGESADDKHKEEIVLKGWTWGMDVKNAYSVAPTGAESAGKATVHELRCSKSVDRASPVIMQALRSNDKVKKATLTCRKAGKEQHEYLKITIQNGRLTSYAVNTEGAVPTEEFALSFKKIEVEYREQRQDGLLGGSVMYSDEII